LRANAQAQLRATSGLGSCSSLTGGARGAATTTSLQRSPVSCSDTLGGNLSRRRPALITLLDRCTTARGASGAKCGRRGFEPRSARSVDLSTSRESNPPSTAFVGESGLRPHTRYYRPARAARLTPIIQQRSVYARRIIYRWCGQTNQTPLRFRKSTTHQWSATCDISRRWNSIAANLGRLCNDAEWDNVRGRRFCTRGCARHARGQRSSPGLRTPRPPRFSTCV
jgi:hypothetical protein